MGHNPTRGYGLYPIDIPWQSGYIGPAMYIRLGFAELFTGVSLAAVAGLVALGLANGWEIAVVPAVTYTIAVGAAYAGYWQYVREKSGLRLLQLPVQFRVVDSRGVCPFGYRKGDLVTVAPGRTLSPQLCPPAEAVLRLAAEAGEEAPAREWCCPVYEHLLVFKREQIAA